MVLLAVLEHVADRIADFARGLQDAVVVTVGEHLAMPLPEPVQGSGNANEQALHAARDRAAVAAFDEEMQVVVQYRVVAEAEVAAAGGNGAAVAASGERRAQRGVFAL